MEYLIVGIAVFFNIAIIKWKFDKARYADASIDASLLILVAFVFSGLSLLSMDVKALLNTLAIILLLVVAYAAFWVLVLALVAYVIYYVHKHTTDLESKS